MDIRNIMLDFNFEVIYCELFAIYAETHIWEIGTSNLVFVGKSVNDSTNPTNIDIHELVVMWRHTI